MINIIYAITERMAEKGWPWVLIPFIISIVLIESFGIMELLSLPYFPFWLLVIAQIIIGLLSFSLYRYVNCRRKVAHNTAQIQL